MLYVLMSSSMTMIVAAQQQLSPNPCYSGYGKTRWMMLGQTRGRSLTASAAKSSRFSINAMVKGCKTCRGKGAIECPGCKGTGKNKKNGNIFERWKCFDCQGFGLKSCPSCGKGGLTPEQRGER